MPKMLDWCFLHRRDALLSGVNAAFKDFVPEPGARFTRCRMQACAQLACFAQRGVAFQDNPR
jgi:hypothetical protein